MPSHFFRTACSYALWSITAPIFIVACCSIAILPASWRYDSRWYSIIVRWWARSILGATGSAITYEGLENISAVSDTPAIFVMNHSSALDIPLVESIIGNFPHIWLIKKEYEKIPVFGWLLGRMHVFVDRKSARSAFLSLRRALDLTAHKRRHLLIFTEGTRSASGEILPFMRGFAFLAQKLNRPVMPISLHNVHTLLPKSSWTVRSDALPLSVRVGEPLTMKENESIDEFVVRVQDWFLANHS